MATYSASYFPNAHTSLPGFTYNATDKALVAASANCEFEYAAGDYWAIKINGDYSLAFDSDGLLAGDVVIGHASSYPRVEFYRTTCGIRQHLGSLTQSGELFVPDLIESDTMPAGLDIKSQVCFGVGKLTVANGVNEVWFLADQNNYLTIDGKLIMLRP